MDAALDAMQASATAAFPADDADGLSKRLDEVVGLLAKAPSSRLRELVAKHKPAALPAVAASGTNLDALVQAALDKACGTKRVSELKPEQYDKAQAALSALLPDEGPRVTP